MMTVKEMMDFLSQVNQESEVIVWNHITPHEIDESRPVNILIIHDTVVIDTTYIDYKDTGKDVKTST